MAHSFDKIWIHAVWSTKLRAALIHPNVELTVYACLAQELREQGCSVRIINGMPDHVHCLFLLNRQKSVAEVIKHIKGCSSHFINQTNLIPEKFSWQKGYAVFSVSEKGADVVYRYIKNQKLHHQHKDFQQEFDACLQYYGLDTIQCG